MDKQSDKNVSRGELGSRHNLDSHLDTSSDSSSMDSRGTLGRMGEQAQSMASNAQSMASNTINQVGTRTDDALSSVGERMASIAGTIREKVPSEGRLGSTVGAVANTLESSGHYLSEHGVADIAGDLSNMVRRYPMQSLWVGLGIGVLLGSALSRR
jgi:ElaB/YqjD/DUF883 family membrane-anchored ribosome-binding protein